MTSARAKEILKLGAKRADYTRYMTGFEIDYINKNQWNIYISQNDVLRKISRGIQLP